MKYILCLLISYSLLAVRDPFSYSDGTTRYVCAGIGVISNGERFAQIYQNGRAYTVRLHDKIGNDEVIKITVMGVSFKKSTDEYEHVILSKKGPSTWVS